MVRMNSAPASSAGADVAGIVSGNAVTCGERGSAAVGFSGAAAGCLIPLPVPFPVFFFQRTKTALRAAVDRSLAVRFLAVAWPPLAPFLRKNSRASGSR